MGKITEILLAIFVVCSDRELKSESGEDDAERSLALDSASDSDGTRTAVDLALMPSELPAHMQEILSNILWIARIQRIFGAAHFFIPCASD